MACYLVAARPKQALLGELADLLEANAFDKLQPFGASLSQALLNARVREDGTALWEAEGYSIPPLVEEREAVLDAYFEEMSVTKVEAGDGWSKIVDLPRLFPTEEKEEEE